MNPEAEGEAELVARIIETNAAQTQHTSNLLLTSAIAEVRWLHDGVLWATSRVERGGTTASYEAALTRVEDALHPSSEIRRWYLERARKWVDGEIDNVPAHPSYVIQWGGMR